MTSLEVEFYARHYMQIEQWAQLESHVQVALRDAVLAGDVERVQQLFAADSGDADVDFYVRNRALLQEWHSLQAEAGLALHEALLAAASQAGLGAVSVGRNGWSTVAARSPQLDLLMERGLYVEMAWTKPLLLSTKRGYPFPRAAIVHKPDVWEKEARAHLRHATRPGAADLGMSPRRGDNWWPHWRVLDEIADGQGIDEYAAQCVAWLQKAGAQLTPTLQDAIDSMK